nr:MAG TPA: hypothetical protein [Caudoviricetes sp.]
MIRSQEEQFQQVTTEERQQIIDQFEAKHYELSDLLKERLLITSDYQFTRKMNELTYYATNGSVYRI